jgi:hypothetical protein
MAIPNLVSNLEGRLAASGSSGGIYSDTKTKDKKSLEKMKAATEAKTGSGGNTTGWLALLVAILAMALGYYN